MDQARGENTDVTPSNRNQSWDSLEQNSLKCNFTDSLWTLCDSGCFEVCVFCILPTVTSKWRGFQGEIKQITLLGTFEYSSRTVGGIS